MVGAIQSLANMEYALYGNQVGAYGNAPSILNNYQMSLGNGYYPQYMTMQPSFKQSYSPQYTSNGNTTSTGGSNADQNFQGLSGEDWQTLNEYYQKNNLIEDGFKGAVTGGVSFWAFENAQSVFHPINAFNAIRGKDGIKGVKELFEGVKVKGSALNNLWKTDSYLMQEAYDATHKLVRDGGSKWFYSKWLRNPIEPETIKKLTQEMETALRSGNAEQIRAITEKMKAARGMNGRIPTAVTWVRNKLIHPVRNGVRGLFGMQKVEEVKNFATAAERLNTKGKTIADSIAESKNMSGLLNGKLSLKGVGKLLKTGLKKDFWGWMAFEAIFSAGKIVSAFQKDTKTGLAQTGQTLGKAAGNAVGWCAGRAAGALAGAKLGAMIGSVCPGLGTVVGAVVGFIGGSVGMWAMGKLTNKIFGKDVADKIAEEKMVTTPEGQTQLIQYALEKAQNGEQMDAATQQVLYKAINLYA